MVRLNDVDAVISTSDTLTLMCNGSLKDANGGNDEFVLYFQWHNLCDGSTVKEGTTKVFILFLILVRLTNQAIVLTKRMNTFVLLPTPKFV